MRRLLTFTCEEASCAATLDEAQGGVGILLVTGGREPRIGAHGWQASLARSLAEAGHPVLRFDRRGVGDSGGGDPGYAGSGPDIAAAAACLREEAAAVGTVIGIGNCDAATALALHHGNAALAGVILLNPWLGGDAEEDELPPAAAIRQRYRTRFFSPQAWLRLITGRIDLRAAFSGLRKAAAASRAPALARGMAESLGDLPAYFVISSGDSTGIAFAAAWRRHPGCSAITTLPTGSHSFAAEGDHERIVAACLDAIHAIGHG